LVDIQNDLSGLHGLVLGFNQRLEIAIDVAHGLTYLHLYAGMFCQHVTINIKHLAKLHQDVLIYFVIKAMHLYSFTVAIRIKPLTLGHFLKENFFLVQVRSIWMRAFDLVP
jgi:hypothetical protein